MSGCGRKALTLLSSIFAVCSLGLLGIAVSTDYWLYLEEGVVLPQNQSTEVRMSLHSGLWRVCFLAGEERGRCFTIEYVMPMNSQLMSESTVSVLKMIRSATPFPLVSLFFMFIGFILSNIGHIRPHRTILAFVSGIFFILSGLSLVVGLVLYISSINDEMLNRTKDAETYFNYKYGWSFAFAAISFLLTESAGVMSVYLFMKRYTAEDMYRPHPGFYRPRLSNCSDYSGQFLHPDAWIRGRSPSDISTLGRILLEPTAKKLADWPRIWAKPHLSGANRSSGSQKPAPPCQEGTVFRLYIVSELPARRPQPRPPLRCQVPDTDTASLECPPSGLALVFMIWAVRTIGD
ncbi:Voltage-dependent calcium channel gamma-5 subunit [Heterocephalus glaber]|uniref:Voltage-dependent calcium channel gamma-5 subunit n=1 Tax=Heterocephalus glaber TaxID=10181 RepID=G5BIH9_HETGA|nr:Voltage-dependent calcium channel gamma-5 subunit [Heterocephalus glaber]